MSQLYQQQMGGIKLVGDAPDNASMTTQPYPTDQEGDLGKALKYREHIRRVLLNAGHMRLEEVTETRIEDMKFLELSRFSVS